MIAFILAALVSIQVQAGYLPAGQPFTVAISCQDCGEVGIPTVGFDTIARLYVDAPEASYTGTWQNGDFFAATPAALFGPGWGVSSLGIGLFVSDPIREDWPRTGTILTFQLVPDSPGPVSVAIVRDMVLNEDLLPVPDVAHDATVHVVIQFDNTNVVSVISWAPDPCHTQPQMIELLACWHPTPQGVISQSTCAFIADTSALHFDLSDVTLGLGEILFWRATAFDGTNFFCEGS